MAGETDISVIIKNMTPELQEGTYIFATVEKIEVIPQSDIVCSFTEKEGVTIIMERHKADKLHLQYEFLASWITLKIHSSLEAIGLTAIFSTELAKHTISCNVISGYYHDHIFVEKKDEHKAITVLKELSKNYQK